MAKTAQEEAMERHRQQQRQEADEKANKELDEGDKNRGK
jgi:hypothetical protein